MKKIFAMLAAIFFCGAMMISCNKDNKEEQPTFPTKADMVRFWKCRDEDVTVLYNGLQTSDFGLRYPSPTTTPNRTPTSDVS